MRIGVNCFLLQANIGGLKQYFLTLFRELLEHDGENEYILFWYAHNADELAKLGTDRWKNNAILLQDQRDVVSHLDRLDLYFCPFNVLYPRPLSKPTVMTLVDIQEVYYPEFFTPEDLYNRQLHYPVSTRMADRVITISEFSKQALVRHHRLLPDKVIVAHLCADERYYRSDQIARPPAQTLPQDFILYPANFWKHKNHDRLLQALRLLREEKGLAVSAVFTGFDEPNGYPLSAKVKEYGLDSQVSVLGYVTIEEMAYLYRQARMLVFPSLFEGFGIPLVEAMAAGCPIVAANATSIPEIAADACELFDPTSPRATAEAITKVWYDGTLRQEMIARGKRRAQNFSPERTAQAHRTAFAEAVNAYSYARFLWNRWVYGYYHQARLEFRWHKRFRAKLVHKLKASYGMRRMFGRMKSWESDQG
jgi:glycosyltransferase involved in cell wall biosynthesis